MFLLYVGNYPTNFQENDLHNLFRGFTVHVEKMTCKCSKTFAFVSCKDIYHAKAIIKKLNGTDVGGRQLIIQPRKDCLQEYLNLFPQEGISKSEPKEAADVKHLCKQKDEKASSVSPLEFKQASSDRKFCDTELSESGELVKPNQNNPREKMHLKSCDKDGKDQGTFDIYKQISSHSKSSQSVRQKVKDENESHWVSVTEFPIGTNTNVLCNLFSAYKPMDVKMICNEPRKDKRVTEALVSFPSKDVASKVAMNFDHTSFHRRTILVKELSGPGLSSDEAAFQHLYEQRFVKGLPVPSLEFKRASSNRKFCDREFAESQLVKPNQNIHREKMHLKSCDKDGKDQGAFDKQISSHSKSNPSVRQKVKDENESHWVSVTNFPFGTNENFLFHLFLNYEPKDVKMICNEPRKDKRVTEALVSFFSEDAVSKVVENFDQTYFHGRIISVQDLSNPGLSAKLLDMHLK